MLVESLSDNLTHRRASLLPKSDKLLGGHADNPPTGREEPVFNLIVGESAIFVAEDFLVRGKPPAQTTPVARGAERESTGH
jgi:hypothetical protein